MASFLDFIRGLGSDASAPILWVALVGFVLATAYIFILGWRSRLMMSKARRVSLLILRIIMLGMLAGALSQVTVTRHEKALSVAFIVDVSQSIPKDEINRADSFSDAAYAARGEVPVRTLMFERKANEVPANQIAPQIKRLSDKPGTDIARALHAGQDLFVKDTYKRAVLITDGNETKGDALFEATVAKAAGIHVDVVPLDTRTDRDIYIESINIPRRARPGERITISVTVVSNFATNAELKIMRGKATEVKKKIDVVPGSNTYNFDTTVKSNYNTNYTASVDTEGDDHEENNSMSALLRVVGNPRIMVYSGGLEGSDLNLIDAFGASRLSVRAAPIEKFPKSVGVLNSFDLVVLSNIDFLKFGKARTDTLHKYVGEYGGGLLVVGGDNGSKLRPDKDKKKKKRKPLPIEQVLPVMLKEKKKTEPNPVALMLVIDKSASMARENKFGMAIRAAKDSIGVLTDRSKVGVILFDDFPRWAIPLQSAKNKEQIIKDLDRFGVDGGTSIYPAMKEAYATLKPLPNKVKHVILLSDGYSISQFQQNAHILEYMASKKITISTVALGKESDQKHLKQIAQIGKGRFYYTEDISQIPKIFMEETKSITKTNVVETEFTPKILKKGEMLRGVTTKSIPKLYGYNSAKAKPTSEVYMQAEKKEPLLARWRYGLGKVTFAGTDSGAEWARNWPKWDQYGKFWTQIARNTLGDQNRRSYRMETRVEGEKAVVDVDALDQNGNFINDLELSLEVSGPEGETFDIPLTQNRPGGYSGNFDMAGFGAYSFQVRAKDTTSAGGGIGRVFLAPPTEFISQTPNTQLMKKIAKATGGRYNPTVEQIFEMPEEKYPRTYPVWPYMLYTALGLLLLSILIRRS